MPSRRAVPRGPRREGSLSFRDWFYRRSRRPPGAAARCIPDPWPQTSRKGLHLVTGPYPYTRAPEQGFGVPPQEMGMY